MIPKFKKLHQKNMEKHNGYYMTMHTYNRTEQKKKCKNVITYPSPIFILQLSVIRVFCIWEIVKAVVINYYGFESAFGCLYHLVINIMASVGD